MNQLVSTEEAKVQQYVDDAKEQRKDQLVIPISNANGMIDAALQEMQRLRQELIQQIRQNGWFKRTFSPSEEQLSLELAAHKLNKAIHSLTKYKDSICQQSNVIRSELQAVLAGFGTQYSDVIQDLITMEEERRQLEADLRDRVKGSQEQVVKYRVDAMSELASNTMKLQAEVRARLNPLMEKVRDLGDQVMVEARKLGVK